MFKIGTRVRGKFVYLHHGISSIRGVVKAISPIYIDQRAVTWDTGITSWHHITNLVPDFDPNDILKDIL